MEIKDDFALFERYISTLLSTSPASFLLQESQGVIDPLIPIADEVVRQIFTTIQPIVEKNHFYSGEIEIDTSNMDDPFFKSLLIKMGYIEEMVPIGNVVGSYSQKDSKISDGDIDVVIYVNSPSQDNRFVEKLRNCIIHELAHAYDDYMETVNSKYGTSYTRYESDQVINRIALSYYIANGEPVEGKLAEVVLFILKSEKEAEQNEFLAEVMRMSKMQVFTDPRNLTAYVSNTEFYKNMMRIKSYLKEILNIQDNEEKMQVTQAFNEIYRDRGMTYDQMCNFLQRHWNFRKNELFKHVAKHIFETVESFVENPAMLSRFLAKV